MAETHRMQDDDLRSRLRRPIAKPGQVRSHFTQPPAKPRPSVDASRAPSRITSPVERPTQAPKRIVPPDSAGSATKIPEQVWPMRTLPQTRPAAPRLRRSTVLRRESVRRRPQQYHRSWLQVIYAVVTKKSLQPAFMGLAVIVFLFGIILSISSTHRAHSVQVKLAAAAQVESLKTASSTTKPTALEVAHYIVAGSSPRYLNISKLDVHARIQPSTSKKDTSLPSNSNDVTWASSSSLPGKTGVTLMTGFASSAGVPGVFSQISNLKSGDVMQIEKGDGSMVNYRVVTTKTFKTFSSAVSIASRPLTSNKANLSLIVYDGTTQSGSQNRIVFAEQF